MTPDQGQATQWTQQWGFVPGPFWGQLPTPPAPTPSEVNAVPSFQFQQDDFVIPATNQTSIQATEEIADPFAGGIQSLQNTTIPVPSAVIEGNTNTLPSTDTMPTFDIGSLSNDQVSETKTLPTPVSPISPTLENTMPTFDMPAENILPTVGNEKSTNTVIENIIPDNTVAETLPTIDMTSTQNTSSEPNLQTPTYTSPEAATSPETTIAPENNITTIQQENVSMPSFDIPTIETVSPIPQVAETGSESYSMLSDDSEHWDNLNSNGEEVTTDNNNESGYEEWSENSSWTIPTNIQENTVSIQEETINTPPATLADTTSEMVQTESIQADNTQTDDTIVTATANEVYTDNKHPLLEIYSMFSSTLDNLLTLKNTNTITITGHRTSEEEVQYEFNKQDADTTVIKHHHLLVTDTETIQTLSFHKNDGLTVMLNNEPIWVYSSSTENTNEDADITYYLKDKLNKFMTIISDEYNQEEKKIKEEKNKKKKSLEILRSF